MLKSPLLFAISLLVSLLSWTGIARANDHSLGLSFDLPPTAQAIAAPQPKEAQLKNSQRKDSQLENSQRESPQPIEIGITRYQAPLPPVNTSLETVELAKVETPAALELADVKDSPSAIDPIGLFFAETQMALPTEQRPIQQASQGGLSRENKAQPNPTINQMKSATADYQAKAATIDVLGLVDDWIFEGGSGSLVAHTVGSAEGTRHWTGKKTKAYYGHTDPGNGVWNLGTFSYQHSAKNPEDADEKQLKRLKRQGLQLEQQATTLGLSLSLDEKLNGLDLANQAPLAALGQGGYIERLAQAYRLEMKGFEAISWARTRAYIDPDTQAWNAPGLGNNLYSISQDQERRMAAIDKALRSYDRNGLAHVALANLDKISLVNPVIEPAQASEPLAQQELAVSFGLPPSNLVAAKANAPEIDTPGINVQEANAPETNAAANVPETSSPKTRSLAHTPENLLEILTTQADSTAPDATPPNSLTPEAPVTGSEVPIAESENSTHQPNRPTLDASMEPVAVYDATGQEPLDIQFATTSSDIMPVEIAATVQTSPTQTTASQTAITQTAITQAGLIETQPSPVLEQVIRPNDAPETHVTRAPQKPLKPVSTAAISNHEVSDYLVEHKAREGKSPERPWWQLRTEDRVLNQK